MKRANRFFNQKGFTLVEMMVVLLVMSIILGVTMWGVTGWIAHFTYIKSEETARYIYLGTQSGLSAYQSRGTLDTLFDEIRKDSAHAQLIAESDKALYGLPTAADLQDNAHEYVCLKATGGLSTNPLLDKLAGPYLTETASVDGSVIVELDLTAKKVYSVFYSTWATDYSYGKATASQIRGNYAIYHESDKDTRQPEERLDYCVGYYGSDQINVATLEASDVEIPVEEAMLYNEETLHLDFRSDAGNGENYTDYLIHFYKKKDGGDEKIFSVKLDPGSDAIFGEMDEAMPIAPTPKALTVLDSGGNELPTPYYFYVGYQPTKSKDSDAAGKLDLTLLLDQQIDSLSLALMEDQDDAGTADQDSLSITRLMGDDPALIYADVTVTYSARAGGAIAGSGSKRSNTENDLFATDYTDTNKTPGKETLTEGSYGIALNRHLYNVRFAENCLARKSADEKIPYTYKLSEDLQFAKSEIYKVRNGLDAGTYEKVALQDMVFATLPSLSEKSMLDGDGHALFGFRLDNTSHIVYERDADGKLVRGSEQGNIADAIGMIAENRGMIRRLLVRNGQLIALTKEKAATMHKEKVDGFPVCDDRIEAAGLLCGRDLGSMQELYLDNDCLLVATVFSKDAGKQAPYGYGVGMLAGTLQLSGKDSDSADALQIHDRLRTGGSVTAALGSRTNTDGTKVSFAKISSGMGQADRESIVAENSAGKYNYGVGGMFGYIRGDFTNLSNLSKQPSLGLSEAEIAEKEEKDADEGGYLKDGLRIREPAADQAQPDPEETITGEGASDADAEPEAFPDWTWSVENRAGVNIKEGASAEYFVGGIAGNLQIALKPSVKQSIQQNPGTDAEGDPAIPEALLRPELAGCRNYGSLYGADCVGGILGVNAPYAYLRECAAFGDMRAVAGVAGGIASENFGYIRNCQIDRAGRDEADEGGYCPQISGTTEVAGAIAGINHKNAVVMDCATGITPNEELILSKEGQPLVTMTDADSILITGNSLQTFGYIVGENYGVINGGMIGRCLAYDSDKENLIIGGVTGINYDGGLVKLVESDLNFLTNQARYVGGIAGENNGLIKTCIFSGVITQPDTARSASDMAYGGIAAINRKQRKKANASDPVIRGCYLVGSKIKARGYGSFTREDGTDKVITKSSVIGGVAGINDTNAVVADCYAAPHYSFRLEASDADAYGTVALNADAEKNIERPCRLLVNNGLVGGMVALNSGTVLHCGYSDKEILLQEDLAKAKKAEKLEVLSAKELIRVDESRLLTSTICQTSLNVQSDNMPFFDKAAHLLENASPATSYTAIPKCYTSSATWTDGRDKLTGVQNADSITGMTDAAEKSALSAETLRLMMMKDGFGDLSDAAQALAGDLQDEYGDPSVLGLNESFYALPKKAVAGDETYHIDPITHVYDASKVTYQISSEDGIGHVGGITGYNTPGGSVEYCCSGKWLVECYHPKRQYNSIGGVAGENTSNGIFRYNMNFAYVRKELTPISDDTKLDMDDTYFHKYQYVGGVIGTQKNTSSGSWMIQGCANAGKVVNFYGNNLGGVICFWTANGGTVRDCYNYGKLVSGYSDDNYQGYGKQRKSSGGFNGAAGGVIGYMAEMNLAYDSNILSCQNHGVVNLPVRGLNRDSKIINSLNVIYMANGAGGVVGELSASNSTQTVVVNVRDCVNGPDAELYGHGHAGGIVAKLGEYAPRSTTYETDSTVVNIITCRNYSDDLYVRTGIYSDLVKKTDIIGSKIGTDKTAGVIFSRDGNPGQMVGYVSLRNNLSMKMQGFYSNGNFDTARYKLTYRMNRTENKQDTALCGYNFYMDERSFQYLNYSSSTFPQMSGLGGVAKKSDTVLAQKKADATGTGTKDAVVLGDNNNGNNDGAQADDRSVNARHIYALRVAGSDNHVLTWQEGKNRVTTVKANNAWLAKDAKNNPIINQRISVDGETQEQYFGPVIHTFTENTPRDDRDYTNENANHYNFLASFLEDRSIGSRMPFSDEFDLDYFRLDRDYVKYAARLNDEMPTPDLVYNMNVQEDEVNGNYQAAWDVKSKRPDIEITTAESFDVRIEYFETDEDFDKTKYNDTAHTYDGAAPIHVQEGIKTNAKLYTFVTPKAVVNKMQVGKRYFAVVRARDDRTDEDSYFSAVATDEKTPFVEIKQKLEVPEFEIVEYEGKWMLHLKNPEAYAAYINNSQAAEAQHFRVGAYILSQGITKAVTLNATELTLDTDAELLTNKKDCTSRFANGKKDTMLRIFAEADNALVSDYATMTVYVPENPYPNIVYSYKEDGVATSFTDKSGVPSYKTTLRYTMFDQENPATVPPIAQLFRVELYGINYAADGSIASQKTVAKKEYALSPGSGQEHEALVTIGYYDGDPDADLTVYDDFGVDIWYASPGQGDVYNYFETTQRRAEGKLRPTGYITDVSNTAETVYLHYTAPLTPPEMEIVAYGDDWYLRLKNPQDYEAFKDLTGFEVGAYMLTNQGIKQNPITFKAADLADPNTALLANMKPLENGYLNNTANKTVYFYAQAEGFYTRTEKVICYIPKVTNPENMNYGWRADDNYSDLLNAPERSFTATLAYDSFGKDKSGNALTNPNGDPQRFAVEVYGTVSGNDVQKTLYFDDSITLAPGETVSVSIAKEDLEASGEDLSAYAELHAVCWYAGTGTGPVYTYFKAPENLALQNTMRSSGYLTVAGAQGARYYYHSPVLEKPILEFVRLARNGNWYLRLLNPESYRGIDVKIRAKLGSNTFESADHGTVLPLGVELNTTALNAELKAWAYADGCFISSPVEYGNASWNRKKLDIFPSLDNTKIELLSLDDEQMTISDDGTLTYASTLHYKTSTNALYPHYVRWELYATSPDNEKVTIAMSDGDLFLDPANREANGAGLPIACTVRSDTLGVDLLDYTDYTLAVWYAQSLLPNADNEQVSAPAFRQYFEITPSVAASVGGRENGVLKLVADAENPEITPSSPAYYFAAPLADQSAYESGKVLYKEGAKGIETIETVDGGGSGVASWTVEEEKGIDDYSLQLTYYQTVKGASFETVEELTVSANTTPEAVRKIAEKEVLHVNRKQLRIPRPEAGDYLAGEAALDFETYDYFVVTTVYSGRISITDRNSAGAGKLLGAYAKDGIVQLSADLFPVPQLEICRLVAEKYDNRGWYLHLKNADDFVSGTSAIAANLRIHVTLYGSTFEFDPLASDKVKFNSGGQNYMEHAKKIPNHSGGGTSVMEYYVTGGGESGNTYQKEIYLPPNGGAALPGASIVLENAKATLGGRTAEGRTLSVEGSISYSGATDQPGFDQRFGLALIKSGKDIPQEILVMTDLGTDLRVPANGDAASIERTLVIPSWISDADIAAANLYIFYKGSNFDDPDDTVKHLTDFTETYVRDKAGKKYLFRDRSVSEDESKEHGYVSAVLDMDHVTIDGAKTTIPVE